MAIKQCPRCAGQYVLSATRCPDCDVELVEVLASDVEADGSPAPTIGDAIDDRAGRRPSIRLGRRAPTRRTPTPVPLTDCRRWPSTGDDESTGDDSDVDGDPTSPVRAST